MKLTLGQKVKAARIERGMTQRELVGSHITRNMLSKIENDAATPSVRTLEYLSKALGVPSGYFLDGSGQERSAPDGLDAARAAYRAGRWGDCLKLLTAEPVAAATDEGYLLKTMAGAGAARQAIAEGAFEEARGLIETARYCNREGMYGSVYLDSELLLLLSAALQGLGERPAATLRSELARAMDEIPFE